MKNKFRTKFLFDMRGFWADEKVDAGAWNLKNPIFKFVFNYFKKKEKEFFLNADYSVSLTHAGKKEILSWDYMQGKSDNISVIPCCADTDLFDLNKIDENTISKWKEKLNIKDSEFIISYLGSIGTWYMLEEMLDFFVELLKNKPDAQFLFITHDEHDRIRESARARSVLDKIIIQPAQRSEVPLLLSLSSVSIFFIRPTYSKISSSPTKQGEIMAMGIPLICNTGIGDTDSIVAQYQSGLSVKGFDTDTYRTVISKFLHDTNFNKENLRIGAIEYFGLKNGVGGYSQIYSSILKF